MSELECGWARISVPHRDGDLSTIADFSPARGQLKKKHTCPEHSLYVWNSQGSLPGGGGGNIYSYLSDHALRLAVAGLHLVGRAEVDWSGVLSVCLRHGARC